LLDLRLFTLIIIPRLEHYNQFADEAQWRKVALDFSLQKRPKTAGPFCAKELLPKDTTGNILRPLTCPLTDKVSQVEMEAGDCEGRLPPLFLWTLALGLVWRKRSLLLLGNKKENQRNTNTELGAIATRFESSSNRMPMQHKTSVPGAIATGQRLNYEHQG